MSKANEQRVSQAFEVKNDFERFKIFLQIFPYQIPLHFPNLIYALLSSYDASYWVDIEK